MGIQRITKLNRLLQAMPRDAVVTTGKLRELGVSPQLARKYVESGWLVRLGSGAFARAGDNVDWRGGLNALQDQLGMSVHVAGRTALELQGRSHFVPLGETKRVLLVSDKAEHLPAWFKRYAWGDQLQHCCFSLFDPVSADTIADLDCGAFSVAMSTAERAMIEEMHLARDNSDIEHAQQLMRGLSTLRPDVVQALLSACRSVKAKRLFLWSAETSGHAWFSRLNTSAVDLGTGKRQLYRGGVLNAKYQITVPPQEELPRV